MRLTELNMLNSRKRQREDKQTTEETLSEKKGRHIRETGKYEFITSLIILYVCLVNCTDQDEEDVKEFQEYHHHLQIPSCNINLDVSDLKGFIEALKQSYFPNHEWFSLGLQLGLLQPTLADIKANHKGDVESCLQECLTQWLRKAQKVTENGGPTWDSLADALHKIGEKLLLIK